MLLSLKVFNWEKREGTPASECNLVSEATWKKTSSAQSLKPSLSCLACPVGQAQLTVHNQRILVCLYLS